MYLALVHPCPNPPRVLDGNDASRPSSASWLPLRLLTAALLFTSSIALSESDALLLLYLSSLSVSSSRIFGNFVLQQ